MSTYNPPPPSNQRGRHALGGTGDGGRGLGEKLGEKLGENGLGERGDVGENEGDDDGEKMGENEGEPYCWSMLVLVPGEQTCVCHQALLHNTYYLRRTHTQRTIVGV